MQDSKKTSQSAEQGLSDTKKLFNGVSGIMGKLNGLKPSTFSFAKKAGSVTLKVVKWVFTSLASAVGAPTLIIVVIACALTLALTSVFSFGEKTITDLEEFAKSFSGDDLINDENVFGAVCSSASTETYTKISAEYVSQLKSMAQTYAMLLKEFVSNGDFPNEVKDAINSIDYDSVINNIDVDTTEIEFKGEYNVDVSDDEKVEVSIDIPLKLKGVDEPYEYISTVVGYIQANYGVIKTYSGENLEILKDDASKKQTVTTTLGHMTPDGTEVVDENYCNSHNGTIADGKCKYTYIPSKKSVVKTGTCTYKGDTWSTDDDDSHTCSDTEWNSKKQSSDSSASDSPSDGSTYKYTYIEKIDNAEVDLSTFDLDDFSKAVDNYIASHKLFYFNQSEWNFDDYKLEQVERVDEEKTYTSKTCAFNGTSWGDEECNKSLGGNTSGLSIGATATITVEDVREIKVTTYNFSPSSTQEISMHIGIDSSDTDFLGKEKEATKSNIEKLATARGEAVDGETEYNTAVSEMVEILNFLCPNQQINLTLITGSTYSDFDAIDSAVNAPEVFGEQKYWYNSSKGVWDVSQLTRKDVYDAIWGYSAYLIDQGLVTSSGWWKNGHQVGTPQCVDFVNARFYAQYGLCPGGGNGRDIATTTVAKYPDKFTNGVDTSGKLNLKAGSIISTTANASPIYGHVGFVEAVETDGNGNITSITISDANFSKLGAPGGVRLHCVYTWEQFKSSWGLNCTFAVPR